MSVIIAGDAGAAGGGGGSAGAAAGAMGGGGGMGWAMPPGASRISGAAGAIGAAPQPVESPSIESCIARVISRRGAPDHPRCDEREKCDIGIPRGSVGEFKAAEHRLDEGPYTAPAPER
jgi:hypothetical protein